MSKVSSLVILANSTYCLCRKVFYCLGLVGCISALFGVKQRFLVVLRDVWIMGGAKVIVSSLFIFMFKLGVDY